MRATKEWENKGYIGISLGLTPDDIDSLVSMLLKLKSQPDQHFHLSNKYEEEEGVGDIEIYVQADEPSNMTQLSLAIAPGSSVSA
jgi:hypothetical protein